MAVAAQTVDGKLSLSRSNTGIMVDGKFPTSESEAAFKAALSRVGPLPLGVKLTVMNSSMWGDNPQIKILLDGREIYREYLYHSEADLALVRRTWRNPLTWIAPSKPSHDLSARFEAALLLAREGAAKMRLKPAQSVRFSDAIAKLAAETVTKVLAAFASLAAFAAAMHGGIAATAVGGYHMGDFIVGFVAFPVIFGLLGFLAGPLKPLQTLALWVLRGAAIGLLAAFVFSTGFPALFLASAGLLLGWLIWSSSPNKATRIQGATFGGWLGMLAYLLIRLMFH
jgi:hypothetical protein